MFSQAFVCPWGNGLCMMSLPVWLPSPVFLPGDLCPGGLCPGGGGGGGRKTSHTHGIRKAGGTHPTEILSCWSSFVWTEKFNNGFYTYFSSLLG